MKAGLFVGISRALRTGVAIGGGFAGLVGIPAVADPITLEMVTVGDAGNAPNTSGYGAVGYAYQIGKHEVTISQYTAFLNAVAASDPYGLYDISMGFQENTRGISQSGSSGSYSYAVIGSSGDKPITFVNWFDAARFANWMQNGQGSGSTETGAYTLGGATTGAAAARNPGAQYYIPTENEWYKAAYYSPVKGGPGAPGYYALATQSDVAPGNVVGSGTNQANCYVHPIGYSVTQSPTYSMSQNYLSDVGAFSNSASYYGTFDQSGNVWEWNDADATAGVVRVVRGGSWQDSSSGALSSAARLTTGADFTNVTYGFRLASPAASGVPEIDPAGLGSVLALVTGALGLFERRRRA